MSTPRLTGKYAVFMIGGVQVANAEECTVSVTYEMLESRAYGDAAKVKQPDIMEFEVTCRKFCRTADLGTFLGRGYPSYVSNAPIRIVIYQAAGKKVFEGDVFVSSEVYNQPTGLITEEITFQGTGLPVFMA